jgi:hypothetical protein
MNVILTQQEADALFALEKHYMGEEQFDFPSFGGSLRVPLFSAGKKEEFMLDITRSHIELQKNTLQTRARKTIILARIDIGGPPHRNPNGEEIQCPHLHLYKQGFNDKWAVPLPEIFSNPSDGLQTLTEFMDFCTIVTKPIIMRELFI